MNLMFRKNFQEGSKGGGGGGGGGRGGKGADRPARRGRNHGFTAMDEYHYRTHIFFSPHAAGRNGPDYEEPRCGPMSGGAALHSAVELAEPPLQPLVVRSPSVSLIKWPPNTPVPTNAPPSPYHSRQVSFSGGSGRPLAPGQQVLSPPNINNNNNNNNNNNVPVGGTGGGAHVLGGGAAVSLTALDRDCFIIPVHSVERFLPAGVPLPVPVPSDPKSDKKAAQGLSVLEVPDPKLCVLAHLMSPLEAIDPVLESPVAQPLVKQRIAASELLKEMAQANQQAVGGMLLANMERHAEFPFISYYVINSSQTNPAVFYNNLRSASLTKFDPRSMRYTAAHTLDLYSEVAAICRPPLQDPGVGLAKSHTPHTGYIISVYKVFEGDDGELFERNWLYWTGARMLYRYLPKCAGLRRISLHKSISQKGDKMYLLVCECASLLADVNASAILIPALRARLCGYTGLYRPIETF